MPLITALLERAAASEQGLYAHRPWESLEASDRPHLEKCWFAWVRAETAVRRGDLGAASGWIVTADRLLGERSDACCAAEVESTRADLLESAGDFRDAMGHWFAAWELWYGFAENAKLHGESIRTLVQVLAGPEQDLDLDEQRLQLEWMADRLSPRLLESSKAVLRLCAPLGDPGPAELVFKEMSGWLDKYLRPDGPMGPFAPVSHADFTGDMANLYDALGMPQQSLDKFLSALDMLQNVPEHPQVTEMRTRYQFNAANQMAKTGRHEEAVAEFDRLAEVFEHAGRHEAAIRARHAAVVSRWKMGDRDEAREQLEAILLAYERQHEQSQHPEERSAIKQNLSQAYSLWLSIAAADGAESDRAKRRILGQMVAMREGSWAFNLRWSDAFKDGHAKKVLTDVEVLDARFVWRADSVLLILEQGVDQLVMATLTSGTGPLKERFSIAAGSPDLTDALLELLRVHRHVTDQLIDRSIGVTSRRHSRFENVCKAAWRHLPEPIKEALVRARTVFVSPSNAGVVDEIPIELLHDGSDYLGLAKPMVRVISISQLLETLSPNRVNRVPTARGLIVRAGEVAALGSVPGADAEVAQTKRAFRVFGAEPELLEAPSGAEFVRALGSDLDVFHFVGHGFADDAGEELYLGEGERVSASELESMAAAPAPICVLSSCLLGRTRHLSTGEQRGVARVLLRRGAPAVIAATYALPDHVGSQFASALYFHAREASIGEAARRARKSLAGQQIHPAAWASFVVLGEPEATLNPSAGSVLPMPRWPALLIRFLATRSSDYLAAVRDGIESDDALSGEQREHIEQAVTALAEGEASFFSEEHLEEEVDFGVALAEPELAYRLVLLVGALRRDDGTAPSEEKMRYLGSCLAIAGLLKDSYMLALLAVQYGDMVLSAMTSEQGRSLLRQGIGAVQWLSADAERLSALSERLQIWQHQLETSIGLSLQEAMGVDSATFEAGDSGDRQALKQMLRNLWVRQASAAVLASNLPWSYWMQRMIGCASEQATRDLFGAIEKDRKGGLLSDRRAVVLDNLLQQYVGPDEVGEEAEQAVLAAFPKSDPDRPLIDLFLLHDRLASGEREIPLGQVQAAIRTCQELGLSGAETYFASVWSERAASVGMLPEAFEMASKTLEALETLSEQDPEYSKRVGMMAAVLLQLSEYTGDASMAARLERRYGDRIRSLIAPQADQ